MTDSDGHDGRRDERRATLHGQFGAVAPTLTSVTPNQGTQGAAVAVTLIGTNFVIGNTAVDAAGGGVTVSNIVVGSTTSLTATFTIDPAAASVPRQ